jgi:ubiquinone/menaquinone biosynthesis C-methylase UbiE
VTQDYSHVTESPGTRVTREALDMVWTRYAFAAPYCEGRDVLEVACGAGQGLGHLRRHARLVVGGDYTGGLLSGARRHYGPSLPLVQLDAHALPFTLHRFDVLILFEAVYYLARPEAFLAESRRVLRPGGLVLVCTANRHRPDFNPSPHSVRYWSARELEALMRSQGFEVELFGAFSTRADSARERIVGALKRGAVALHLMPKTMRGKELLKRLFLGRLTDFPPEVDEGTGAYDEPVRIAPGQDTPDYKVLYAVGRLV